MDLFLTIDVGSTLGRFTGPSVEHALAELAQRYHPKATSGHRNPWADMAAEVNRWFLHVAPELTDEVKADVCDYLMIPVDAWPAECNGGFEPYDYTRRALSMLGRFGPMVALSNISIVTGPQKVRDVKRTLGDLVCDVHTSYDLRTRKPHARAWEMVAACHDVKVGDTVHAGDRIVEDVYGALNAGCRGAIFVNTRGAAVPEELRDHPQVCIVDDLRGAPFALRGAFTRSA